MNKRSALYFVALAILLTHATYVRAVESNPLPGVIMVDGPTTPSAPATTQSTDQQQSGDQKKEDEKKDGSYECLNTYPLHDPYSSEAIQEKALDKASGGKRKCFELRTKGQEKGDTQDLQNIDPKDKEALDKQIAKDIQNLNSSNVTCNDYGTCVDTSKPVDENWLAKQLADPNNIISPLNPNNPLNQGLSALSQQIFGNSMTDGVFSPGVESGFGMNGYQLDTNAPSSYAQDPRPPLPTPQGDLWKLAIATIGAECYGQGKDGGAACAQAVGETARNRHIAENHSSYARTLCWKDMSGCNGYYQASWGNANRRDRLLAIADNPVPPNENSSSQYKADYAMYLRAETAAKKVWGLDGNEPSNIANGHLHNWLGGYPGAPGVGSNMNIGGEMLYTKTWERSIDISQFKGAFDPGPYNPTSFSNLGQNPPSQYASNQSQTSPNRTLNFPATGIAQVDRTLNTFLRTAAGFSGANIQNPLGMMGMFGNSAGGSLASGMFSGLLQSLLGNSAPRTGTTGSNPFASNQSSAGLSGLVGNLANNLNPFSSILGSNPLTNGQNLLNQPNAQAALNNLLTQQSRTLQQFANQSPTNTNDYIRQLQQLQRQNLEQLRQFSYQYPDANQTYLREQQRIIEDSLTQLERYAATTLPTQFGGDAQNVINEYLGQQASLTVNPNGTSGGSQTNTTIASDLTVTALRANKTLTNEYRFRGSLSRILLNANDNIAFSEVGSYFGSNVAHELLLDLSCDGTVDEKLRFNTPYYSILPRSDGADVLLSEYLEVPEDGLHCFAFAVDVDNLIPELNENNNQSAWREFIASVGTPGSAVPDLPALNFEISVYADGYDTLVQDWTDEDVTIVAGQQIAFRWDAPEYQECVPLLSSLTPDVAANTSPVERNTLSEKIELHEHNGYYELRCSVDGATRIETIHITVEEETDEDS